LEPNLLTWDQIKELIPGDLYQLIRIMPDGDQLLMQTLISKLTADKRPELRTGLMNIVRQFLPDNYPAEPEEDDLVN